MSQYNTPNLGEIPFYFRIMIAGIFLFLVGILSLFSGYWQIGITLTLFGGAIVYLGIFMGKKIKPNEKTIVEAKVIR